jgi:hypothetical protein
MTLVLSKDEYNRIKRSVLEVPEDRSHLEKKAQLKKLSQERLKHWPNTLEALRKKKENFMKEKAEQEELKRQEIDKQEAELRRAGRLETIRKANDLLYEQTDKMKLLRSQQLYADVIYTREFQMKDKTRLKEEEKVASLKHHEVILKQVEEGEKLEKQKLEKQQKLIEDVKLSRKQQLHEVNTIRGAEKQKVIEAGLRMKREAEERVQEEVRNYELRQKMIDESNIKMVASNEDLKRIKEEIRYKEQLAEQVREEEIAKIDHRKMMLKHLEKQRFEKAQQTRQKLIDTAVQLLAAKSHTEEVLLQQQMQDLKDKEDRLLAEKKERDEKFRELIAKSRVEQIGAREQEKQKRYEEENGLLEKWRGENEQAMQNERDKIKNARMETMKLKKIQYDEGQENAKKKREQKMIEIEQSKFLHSIRGNDDARFIELCKQEIEKNIATGKPVYTLLKALEHSQPVLIPAKTVTVPRKGVAAGGATVKRGNASPPPSPGK